MQTIEDAKREVFMLEMELERLRADQNREVQLLELQVKAETLRGVIESTKHSHVVNMELAGKRGSR